MSVLGHNLHCIVVSKVNCVARFTFSYLTIFLPPELCPFQSLTERHRKKAPCCHCMSCLHTKLQYVRCHLVQMACSERSDSWCIQWGSNSHSVWMPSFLLSTAVQLLVLSFGLPNHFLPSSSILDKSLPNWHF